MNHATIPSTSLEWRMMGLWFDPPVERIKGQRKGMTAKCTCIDFSSSVIPLPVTHNRWRDLWRVGAAINEGRRGCFGGSGRQNGSFPSFAGTGDPASKANSWGQGRRRAELHCVLWAGVKNGPIVAPRRAHGPVVSESQWWMWLSPPPPIMQHSGKMHAIAKHCNFVLDHFVTWWHHIHLRRMMNLHLFMDARKLPMVCWAWNRCLQA